MNRFGLLLGARVRRDTTQLLLWIVGSAALVGLTWVGVSGTYFDAGARAALLATAVANPVVLLFRGLPSGAEEGAFLAFLVLPFVALLAGLMSSFLAVRHTRAEEERGRAELIGATAAGRLLPLLATIAHGAAANAAFAAACAAVLAVTGLGARGALLVGVGAGAVGFCFFAVSLLLAQLVTSARAANAAGAWVVVGAYLLCGVGNAAGTPSVDAQRIESAWPAWLSPFGWVENTRPYDADDPRPLLLCAALSVAAALGAVALQSVRDLGAGLLPARRGRATAAGGLRGPFGLAWRIGRGSVLGWTVGGLVIGLLATRLTSVLREVSTRVPSVEQLTQALARNGSLEQGAVVVFFALLGVLASCCAVQSVCHARQEESRGTAEHVLSGAVSRLRWVSAYAALAVLGVVATVSGGVVGAVLGIVLSPEPAWELMRAVAVTGAGQAVAATVSVVVATVLLVTVPRLVVPLAWTSVVVGAVLGLFGPLFGFPRWLVDAAPIATAPTLVGDTIDPGGLAGMLAVIAVGAGASAGLARRRELVTE